MSHRVYLYNVGMQSDASVEDRLMVEANYQLPPLLLPLLSSGGSIGPNRYNTAHGPHPALYFDAAAGIAQLRRFFDAIESQAGLVQDVATFNTARTQLFQYLDTLDLPRFHLDMWDVFTMTDVPFEDQAHQALDAIAQQNRLISAAIDAKDLSLLDAPEAAALRGGVPSFSALLNDWSPRYGWGCFHDAEPEDTIAAQPFEQSGKWGLRDASGKVLASAIYDAVYEPGPMDMAVVTLDDKFGYLDQRGDVAIALVWDDAYDFDYGGLAIVACEAKFGLIDVKGKVVVPAEFDALDPIGDHGDYAVCKAGRWGVLDSQGAVVIACEHEAAFEPLYRDMFVLEKQSGKAKGNAVQNAVPSALLYHRHAGLLASGFSELIGQSDCPNLVVVRQGKRYGAVAVEPPSLVLPVDYDNLAALPATVNRLSGNFMLATQGKRKGVFDADPDVMAWLFPMDDWQDAIWLHERRFAVQRDGRWYLADSAVDFARQQGTTPATDAPPPHFDLIVRKPPFNGFAYAFAGQDVWIADDDGLYLADTDQILADMEYDYGVKLSREARRRLTAFVAQAGG